MSKLRLLFVKEGRASYISHLDLMRTFHRVFSRTGLDLSHSQGYHPHPVLSIVLPLPVGQSSVCELLDLAVEQICDGAGVADKLNAGLPEGVRALMCYESTRAVRELAFVEAEVELLYDNGVPTGCVEALQGLFAQETVVIQKRTKRRDLADVDLKPLVRSLDFTRTEKALQIRAVVVAQNPGMNPALLGTAIATHLPLLTPDFVRCRRTALLDSTGATFR